MIDAAFEFIASQGGIATESSYPVNLLFLTVYSSKTIDFICLTFLVYGC